MSKNIKEIGKELLGKSLNSFHRKTGLTQLEKNNEMQDGILDGILSQVDDAYIEKTEQSNVIHLDGSGDGVVVLDSIEGNTMVNLANIRKTYINHGVIANDIITLTQKDIDQNYTLSKKDLPHKIGEKYTVVINVIKNTCSREKSVASASPSGLGVGDYALNFSSTSIQQGFTGVRKILGTTREVNSNVFFHLCLIKNTTSPSGEFAFQIMVLEGDWTNREIPASYFEGLQSSFEDKVNDEGKYEIEILSNNKNLIDNNKGYRSSYASWIPNIGSLNNVVKTDTYNATFKNRGVGFLVKDLKPNTQYTLSIPSLLTNNKLSYALYDNENSINNWNYHIQGQGNISTNKITFTTPNRKTVAVVGVYGSYEVLHNNGTSDGTVTIGNYRNLQLEIGNKNTEFNLQKQNKIKLLINEPLRSVPNGTRDRLCVKENKLFVERNCYEYIITGNEDISRWGEVSVEGKSPFRINADVEFKYAPKVANNNKGCFNNNRFINQDNTGVYYNKNGMCLWKPNANHFKVLGVCFDTNQLTSDTIEGCKQWFKDNKTVVVCELEEPYYEEVINEYGEPIILEGYENGTLYIDSTVIPTTTVRYTPKMESFKTLKEVNKNNNLITLDINENITPYIMDVDYMIMEKELCLLNTKNIRKMEELDMTSMQKRTQDMLERLIKGKTLTEQECKTRVTTYLNAGKITDDQAEELMLVISEIYN